MDQNNDIVTENLTKRFIQHGGISLAPQSVSEFPLNHAERGLNIGAQVVVLQELFPPVIEVVEQLPIVGSGIVAASGIGPT
jgi:hypothetical protein